MTEDKTLELVDPRLIIGYERPQHLEILASLICALRLGIKLPPVKLVKVSGVYHIVYKTKFEYKEGGHHRVLANYLLDWKQPAIILEAAENPLLIIPECFQIRVPELTVVRKVLSAEDIAFKEFEEGVKYIRATDEKIDETFALYEAALRQQNAGPNWP